MELTEWWQANHTAVTTAYQDRIKAFAWFLQTIKGAADFSSGDIRGCFAALNLQEPTNTPAQLSALVEKNPKQLLRSGSRFKLEFATHSALTEKFGHRTATVQVHKLLSELPAQVSDAADKAFLEECLICFRHRAFRAAVVMAWNLAFDHLCVWVLKDPQRLAKFNVAFPVRFPKEKFTPLTVRDDFTEWKESQVIAACNTAGVITSSLNKVLEEKLKRRNLAAHPSGVVTTEPTAEEFIKDVVENVVLKLK